MRSSLELVLLQRLVANANLLLVTEAESNDLETVVLRRMREHGVDAERLQPASGVDIDHARVLPGEKAQPTTQSLVAAVSQPQCPPRECPAQPCAKGPGQPQCPPRECPTQPCAKAPVLAMDAHVETLGVDLQHGSQPAAEVVEQHVKSKTSTGLTSRAERWSAQEHQLFGLAMAKYPRRWNKIAECVGSRTPEQVQTHWKHQLYARKQELLRQQAVLKFARANPDNRKASAAAVDIVSQRLCCKRKRVPNGCG